MNTGKTIRINNIFSKDDGKTVIVAIDHGGIAGPMKGINEPAKLIQACVDGGADTVLTTRGFIRAAEGSFDRSLGIILRLTGGFTVFGGKFEEEVITSVKTALKTGSAGVAVTVKFGHEREGHFTQQASLIADSCEDWGLPLMIEAMARGNGFDGKPLKSTDSAGIKLASRAAAEIGADMVKTYYTGNPDSFAEVVEGCMVPVVILGGAKTDSIRDVFSDVYYSIQAGGSGIAIGRNIWQHENTQAMVEAMCGIVHEGWSVDQAMAHI
ncbi:MAG: 2-amino-3,7-dideoxy-D-threo-hept-6-ulosonate synthase [Spirochaetales bacterium]|uniref:2-amino-3,7-dideoxy-D-threo-hept-6-ulosonate synthase n=1 Tax=Candidatus Thalassospirochaeta sargassi TaxID=3119039 RepID=A0AAJ1IEC0_9SPIO|nr:2-amino-3,7-dideoxy-D-threo-hept-6-ulosonate synthase [Spirochaetales bacterium]